MMGFNVSYTSFSVAAPGRAYDGVTIGSDQWNELLGQQMAILEAAGYGDTIETVDPTN